MKRRTVRITPLVQEQINEQVFYIAADSIDNALAWETRLRMAILKLADAADYSVDEDMTDRFGKVIRRMVFERHYLIHYDVEPAVVSVLNSATLPSARPVKLRVNRHFK